MIKKRQKSVSPKNHVKISRIYKNCFLGSKAGLQEETFASLGITQLLYLSEEPCPKVSENVEVLDLGKESEGFFHLLRATSFADFDRKKMETWFQKAFRFLDKGMLDGKVSVCCTLGKVRSATVVIAYFMHRFALDFATAKSFVESKREIGLDAFAEKYLTKYGGFCTKLSESGLIFESSENLLQIV
ncbi:MAG: hypothetical protein K940chlam8_00591 [Chlamydiae bacterium]|nr:hypothetical protein [Chlamydiota bacterium]